MAEDIFACGIAGHRKKIAQDNAYTDELAQKFAGEVGVPPRPFETKDEQNERGVFVRQANYFTQKFGTKEGELKAESGRYRIYWAHGCHWSNRPVIVRDILGLEDVISDIATTHSGETNVYGHGFADKPDYKDPVTGAYFLSEFYKNADPNFHGRATTPTLVDVREKKAVNSDYHRLSNYIEVFFYPFQKTDIDLYPKKYRREIDEFNDWLFPHINNGHYRMAFAQSLTGYKEDYEDFYASLDLIEKRLEKNRFLFGDYITDADVRAYVTFVRWETAYYHNLGPQKKRLSEYENIWGYVKELYAIPAFRRYTVTLFHLHKDDQAIGLGLSTNYARIIEPQINYDEEWKSDGSRAKLSRTPDELYLRHPKGEKPEDYYSDISVSRWNSPNKEDRDPTNYYPEYDASVNTVDLTK